MTRRGPQMSIGGDAGRLALIVLPAASAATVATALRPRAFQFLGRFRAVGTAVGSAVAAVGILFLVTAVIGLIRAHRADRLAVRGAYRLCRHPLYAWLIFLLPPPAALLADSWLFFLMCPVVFALVRGPVRLEDDYLAARYGASFRLYRSRVRALLPIPRARTVTPGGMAGATAAGLVFAVLLLGTSMLVVSHGIGVSRTEAAAELPGDDLIAEPKNRYTQAIVVEAPPRAVWPWLVQAGYRRAGWHNAEAINRFAALDYFYENDRSAGRTIPELQNISPDDDLSMIPRLGMFVVELVVQERLVMAANPTDPTAPENLAMAYLVEPLPRDRSRVVVRFSATYPGDFVAGLKNAMVNEIGGGLIEVPALLHRLKTRAERLHAATR